MKIAKTTMAIATAIAAVGISAQAHAGATFDNVISKGFVQCGVSDGLPGFSYTDSSGKYLGIDVDVCRAVAAAVLGDADKVRFSPLTAKERFTALQSGEIDVLYRNSTQTFVRGATLGFEQLPVNFYDGQGFAVRRDAGVKKVADLSGATICLAQGTTHELTIGDVFRARGLTFQPVVFERIDTMYDAFFAGRCDAITQDSSALAGALGTVAPNPDQYEVLAETISKEPLGPFVRKGDQQWSDIVRFLHYALVEAEELGITAANAGQPATDPTAQRLLGQSGEFGKALGLEPDWAKRAIVAVGNYGELFERNVGQASPLKLQRGLNGLWTKGGLMYAIPFR